MRLTKFLLLTTLSALLLASTPGTLAAPPPQDPQAVWVITYPTDGTTVSGEVEITGTATHPNFGAYGVLYGAGPRPAGDTAWVFITAARVPNMVVNGTLATWNTTTLPNGQYGETYVAELLASVADVQPGPPADLVFAGTPIEVKTARVSHYNGQSPGYQFILRKTGHTTIKHAAVVVLVCLSPNNYQNPDCYVIPTNRVGQRRKIGLPANLDTYTGIWADYREAWHNLA